MNVAHLRLAPVGETMFPPRTPFFQRPSSLGNLPVPPAPPRSWAGGRPMNALGGVPVAWMLARAAGLVAFGLLTLSVWLGLAMSTKLIGPRRQKALFGWHQTLAWTGLSMLVLHAGALLFDPTLHFGLPSVLVPFAAPWRPVAVAAGVLAGWLTLMLAVSFRLRRWIGQKGWRRLHYASFAAFVLALGHALTSGTDLRGLGGPILAAVAAGPVIWLVLARILTPGRAPRPTAAPAAATPTRTLVTRSI